MSQFILDREYETFREISGIDEAGRGCLAGPVVVARVTWSPQEVAGHAWFADLADSKLLTPQVRETLFPRILEHGTAVRVAVLSNILVDYLNILKATLHGFELVAPPPDPMIPLLIDGNRKPPTLKWARAVVKGDRKLSAVAAAGVVAKVVRDHLMVVLHRTWPGYGFAGHKGYATAAHRRALAQLGPSPRHRKSFRPVSDWDREELPADRELLTPVWPSEREALLRKWRFFRDDYHRFSMAACRKALDRFRSVRLNILPSASDPIDCYHP